jgi:hypothetical protein
LISRSKDNVFHSSVNAPMGAGGLVQAGPPQGAGSGALKSKTPASLPLAGVDKISRA